MDPEKCITIDKNDYSSSSTRKMARKYKRLLRSFSFLNYKDKDGNTLLFVLADLDIKMLSNSTILRVKNIYLNTKDVNGYTHGV